MKNENEPGTRQIISVAQKLERLIEFQELRVHELRARELESAQYIPEMRHNIELLPKMYALLLNLEAVYRRGPRPPETAPSEGGFQHPVYTFLDPDEARQLLRLEEQVERGEINIIQLYQWAGPIFEWENQHPRGDQR
jgi:hypothetical protein